MGGYDCTEIFELIGIYILSRLSQRIKKENCRLCRDDGLMIIRNANGKQPDKTTKDIIKIFKEIRFKLKIDIKTSLKQVDFLDVTFDLTNATHRPLKKENDQLLYINTS